MKTNLIEKRKHILIGKGKQFLIGKENSILILKGKLKHTCIIKIRVNI
jgi:hypothetical protein